MPRLSVLTVLLLKLLKHSGIDRQRQRALCKGNVSVFISHFHGTLYEDINKSYFTRCLFVSISCQLLHQCVLF